MSEKKGFFGGSLFLKIIVLFGIALIVSIFFFGVQLTLPSVVFTLLRGLVGTGLIIGVIFIVQAVGEEEAFSPTGRFRDKMKRIAILSKPFNVKKLYIRGEDMRVYSYWGKILGLAFIPYLSASDQVDDEGSYIYEVKKDKAGKPIIDDEGKPVMQTAKDFLTEKDGDWFVVTKRGIPFFGTVEYVRCHYSLMSDIGESIWIKTPNLVPIGDYFYPAQQFQTDILRVKRQHQAEAVIETYSEFMDYLAKITEQSMKADQVYQKIKEVGTEQIGGENNAGVSQ